MLKLAELYSPIAKDIDRATRIFGDTLISDQAMIADVCRHVDQFHGKQLRPAFLLLTARACGKITPEHHVLAAVVEMVHIATLVHDDVLDESDIRRRAATVNRLWGAERAVLTGDFLFSHAFTLCSSLDSQFASQVIGRTAITLCEGEMMQDANGANFDLSEDEYFDIIRRKTASLIGACGLLGAKYGGADERTVRRMRELGEALGVAFQITDDLLDLMGDEAEAGKSLGRDVYKRRITLPLIHFLRTAQPAQRAELLSILRESDPQRFRKIAPLLADSESLDYSVQTAHAHVGTALEILADLPASDAQASLQAMAEFILARRY